LGGGKSKSVWMVPRPPPPPIPELETKIVLAIVQLNPSIETEKCSLELDRHYTKLPGYIRSRFYAERTSPERKKSLHFQDYDIISQSAA